MLYKIVPRLLANLGLVKSNVLSAALTVVALVGMTLTSQLAMLFALNFMLGIGLILRWIACDTWIVSVPVMRKPRRFHSLQAIAYRRDTR
jgi:hypothetical protein